MIPIASGSRVRIADPDGLHATHGAEGVVVWSTECAVCVVIDGGDKRGWTYPLRWVQRVDQADGG